MINKPLKELLELSPAFAPVKAALGKINKATPEGRCSVDGDNIFILVSRYNTLPEKDIPMEAHRGHSEIHLLLEGAEYIGYCDTAGLNPHTPYNEANDIEFWHKPAAYERAFIGGADNMAVFFNCAEGHAPRIQTAAGPQPVMKAVVKFKKEILDMLSLRAEGAAIS